VRLLLGATDPAGLTAQVAALTAGAGVLDEVGERWV
jgi:hypothetical protein